MHPRLAEALSLLEIRHFVIDEQQIDSGESKKQTITAGEHARALFAYLELAGYLTNELIDKSVDYLSLAKPFKVEPSVVKEVLKTACASARKDGKFNVESFIAKFAHEDFFTTADILDILTFLQQTAFDRNFGEERDRLSTKPWLEQNAELFLQHAKYRDKVCAKTPDKDHYCGIGISGAASTRIQSRLKYYAEMKVSYDEAWALSGDRELSKGLDEQDIMVEVATWLGKPVNFVEKPVGVDKRLFLDGITETHLTNYLLYKNKLKMGVIASRASESKITDSKDEDHGLKFWRATTKQNAKDVAPIIIDKIKREEIKPAKDGAFYFLNIAEQPYSDRMARQIQREFNRTLSINKLKIKIIVEGCGYGIAPDVLKNPERNVDSLLRINSEFGSDFAERYLDARNKLELAGAKLRPTEIVMFQSRDKMAAQLRSALVVSHLPIPPTKVICL